MKAKSILLLGLITIFCTGMMCECDDEPGEPQLPPETTTGENTFGCLVNGKVWRNGGVGFPNYSLAVQQLNDTSVIIQAYRDNDTSYSGFLLFVVDYELGVKRFNLNSNKTFITYTNLSYKNNNECIYEKMNNGFIEFSRFDISQNIVSGIFQSNGYNTNCGNIEITQGRFDLKK